MSETQALAEARGPEDGRLLRLYAAERDFLGFNQAAREARRERDAAIREAVIRYGVDYATVRKLTGLSRSRLSQIVNR